APSMMRPTGKGWSRMKLCQRHTNRTRSVVLAVAVVTVGTVAPLTTASAAQPPAVPASVVAESPDYATTTFADPWDYSNREDLITDKGPTAKLTSPSSSGGRLTFKITGAGYVSPVWGGYPGSLYLDRDGSKATNRVAASAYTHLSLRAYASQATSSALVWFTCPGLSSSCQGAMPASLKAGWNTYDFLLANNPAFGKPKEWAGAIHGLRYAMNGSSSGTTVVFDWMRLYRPGVSGNVTTGGTSVLVDDGVTTWSAPCVKGTSCSVDLSMLPPGTYRFADPASSTSWSSPVQVAARARPVVLNPSEAGCGDWAKSARSGNRWDFNQTTDVKARSNATGSTANGIAYGTNAKPVMNDPMLHLALGSKVIDGRKWRRITFTMGYDGAFNLADVSGGGTMARVMWRRAESGTSWLQTNDIVTYSGNRTYTIDLGAAGVNEPNAAYRYPITSSAKVTALRIDPNEDRGARRWRLYDVRLAYTCFVARGGTFPISFKDNAFTAGSTASVYVVPSATPRTSGGTLVGTINQASGTNTVSWRVPAGQAVGTYWVYVTTSNGTSTTTRAASGPLKVT
ncbi:MAG TPA: hypothetical protein VM097_06660, partial [Mycobacteriales bacterium]|nr:hypothetical protein [Mycobacteriales bacterium]